MTAVQVSRHTDHLSPSNIQTSCKPIEWEILTTNCEGLKISKFKFQVRALSVYLDPKLWYYQILIIKSLLAFRLAVAQI